MLITASATHKITRSIALTFTRTPFGLTLPKPLRIIHIRLHTLAFNWTPHRSG